MRVLANATELIELLAGEGALPLIDVATRIGVPRSSIYRLCEGLAAVEMVELLPDSMVRLSTRWLALADAARARMSEWRGVPEVLAHLVERTGQTAFLSVPYGSSALCLDWCQGRAIDVLAYRPGSTIPLYVGAAGRTFAAYGVPPAEGDRRRLTERTIIDPDVLAADREQIRRDGYALSEEDVTVGIGALGVPILAPDGTLRGALSLGGLVEDVRKHRDDFVAELRTGVERLSAVQADSRE
jgi:DNA-binding IclR family transcriptional regulator